MANTTAFVPTTTGPQYQVSGSTTTPASGISITTNSSATDAQLVQFILANTFVSSPNLVSTVGQGTLADPTGAGTFIIPNKTALLEVGTVGGDPNGTIFTQRLNVIAPTLPHGESEAGILDIKTATSATPGGPLDSNVADTQLPIFFVSAPALSGLVANQPVQATQSIKPFSTTSIKDTDFSTATTAPAKDVATIIVSENGNPTDNDGLLTGAGLSKTAVGTYTLPNAVAPGQLTTELQALQFNTANVFGNHTVSFQLSVQDVPPTTVTEAKVVTPANQDPKVALTTTDATTSVAVVGQPQPPPATNFHVVDTTTGTVSDVAGTPYTGPEPGIKNEIIMPTADNLNITSVTPNTFIHTGSGKDAIDVSGANGTNILDGSTGSNFLVGGTGIDQFFVDDRGPTADIFSTIKNFHAGDTATVWGVTPQDFMIKTADNVLPSAPGLDFAITKSGSPNANLNIPGYSTADLSNGRLSMSFGKTPDLPGLPGSNFMLISAT